LGSQPYTASGTLLKIVLRHGAGRGNLRAGSSTSLLFSKEFEATVRRLKEMRPDVYVVAISPVDAGKLERVNAVLPSYDPQELLEFLARRFEAATSDESS
jgi:hypothetical protein